MLVEPDRLDSKVVALQVLDDWLESSNRECEMTQPRRLRLRWPCRRVRKREEFDLGRSHLQVALPGFPLRAPDLANDRQSQDLSIEELRTLIIRTNDRDVVNGVQHLGLPAELSPVLQPAGLPDCG